MHSSDSLEDEYIGSGKILGYSRHKYGDENHTREILEICESREQLRSREKEIVNEELLRDPLNINLRYGGEGGFSNEATVNGNKSPKRNHEIIQEKIRHTLKIRNKKRFGGKYGFNGFVPDRTGRKHSLEAKIKMSNTRKERKLGFGKKNSQYGTCWVCNRQTQTVLKIKKEQLEQFISDGFIRGRK